MVSPLKKRQTIFSLRIDYQDVSYTKELYKYWVVGYGSKWVPLGERFGYGRHRVIEKYPFFRRVCLFRDTAGYFAGCEIGHFVKKQEEAFCMDYRLAVLELGVIKEDEI